MADTIVIHDDDAFAQLGAAGLRTYDDFVECALGDVVAQSGTSLTRRITLPGASFYLKRYRYEGSRWRHRFRTPKAFVEARNYALLRERCGADVPDVIALGARRRGLRLIDTFLLTRGVEDVAPLEDALGTHATDRREIINTVADLVRRMHAAGFCHADLQWRNILVRAGRPPRLVVLDSSRGGLRRSAAGRQHGQIRDLSSLDKLARTRLTRTDRLRFLLRYSESRRIGDLHRAIIARLNRYVATKATT